MAIKSEFTVKNAYQYNESGPWRWITSHLLRYKYILIVTLILKVLDFVFYALGPVYVGEAADLVMNGVGGSLINAALMVLLVYMLSGAAHLGGSLTMEFLAQRMEVDSREELYRSLLGKSQIYHDRQRVGDIMARATEDVRQLNPFVMPGLSFIFETVLGIGVPILYIALIEPELTIIPIGFVLIYIVLVKLYADNLLPVVRDQREQFGKMNSGLEESISGIEVVKASTQEDFERAKFGKNAKDFRDYFVKQGQIEARYLPLLFFGVTLGLVFLHGLWLNEQGRISLAQFIAVMGLMGILRFPAFISIFSISLVQMGIAGAERILEIIKTETDLDQNLEGHRADIQGEIVFDNVSFDFGDDKPVLAGLNFTIKAGQTVAIVGQTGSGKSTLTQLVNRTYDTTQGRILIDGMDVRDWNLTALRSQIANIEQDVFLFSRSLADNIAFGQPDASRELVEQAAHDAQAHDFIMSFKEGYETEVGDRGVTLSGGQRQRIALARAFLADPRILILDDSTSAIDSATEDEIQKAIHRIQEGRTTLLITHRLSQIRWADVILVVDQGQMVGVGTHEELLRTSPHYRRIFARYDVALPPLEETAQPETVAELG